MPENADAEPRTEVDTPSGSPSPPLTDQVEPEATRTVSAGSDDGKAQTPAARAAPRNEVPVRKAPPETPVVAEVTDRKTEIPDQVAPESGSPTEAVTEAEKTKTEVPVGDAPPDKAPGVEDVAAGGGSSEAPLAEKATPEEQVPVEKAPAKKPSPKKAPPKKRVPVKKAPRKRVPTKRTARRRRARARFPSADRKPTVFKVNDKVVHPHHGAAVITDRMEQEVDGVRRSYFELKIATEQLVVYVPVETIDLNIRPVISKTGAGRVLRIFKDEPQAAGSNWSRWYKVLNEKMTSGDIHQVAEVVRDLTHAQHTKGISPALKRMLSKARVTLTSELAFAFDIDSEEATDRLDRALPTPGA